MKKALIILLLFFEIFSSQAQKINKNYIGKHIDTVYFFSPFGFISTIDQGERQTSSPLTKSIGDTLSKLIFEQLPGKHYIIYDSMLNNDYKTQDNIILALERVKTIENQIFSLVPTGASFDSILDKYPGRYFGFIYYNGFMNNQVKNITITSITLIVVTSILTAGMLTMYMIPIPSEINVTLLIIDKKEDKFVFYVDKKQTKSFSMNINKHKLVNKLLKQYKKDIR